MPLSALRNIALSSKLVKSGPTKAPSILRKLSIWLLRIFLFFVWFFLCLYLSFPYGRLRQHVARAIERHLPGADVEIAKLEPHWFTGVEIRGFRLKLPPASFGKFPFASTMPSTEEQGAKGSEKRGPSFKPSLNIAKAQARLRLLPLLWGERVLDIDIEIEGGGRVRGLLRQVSDEYTISLTIDSLELSRLGILRAWIPVSLFGELRGSIELTLGPRPDRTRGSIDVRIEKAKVGEERFRIPIPIPGMSGLELAQIQVGQVELQAPVERGLARIEKLNSKGEDVELRGVGTARILLPLHLSAIDLLIR
ncbi:MAG: type II secretion system protein GspN, partial [Sandaracinaceae bacterium]|nr:type II secretion system protein GspN [Sandaracinaceae bacterium]